MFDSITKSNSVVSFDKTSVIVFDPCISFLSTPSIVLLVISLDLDEGLEVVRALLILVHPKHTNKTAVLSILSLILPAAIEDLLHGFIGDSRLKLFLVSVDPSELVHEVLLALLTIVDCNLLPEVNDQLSIFRKNFDLMLLQEVNHFLGDLIERFLHGPVLLISLLILLIDGLDLLVVVRGYSDLVVLIKLIKIDLIILQNPLSFLHLGRLKLIYVLSNCKGLG